MLGDRSGSKRGSGCGSFGSAIRIIGASTLDRLDRREPALDGLRGLAALIVAFSHIGARFGLPDEIPAVFAGQVGVMIFFTLSGYLMGGLYLPRPFERGEIWAYGVRRAARVAPLFYTVVGVAVIFNVLVGLAGVDFKLYPTKEILPLLLLIKGHNIFWTIPVEVQFYVIFLGLWWAAARSHRLVVTLLCLGIATILAPISQQSTILSAIPFFLCGALISILPRSRFTNNAVFSLFLGVAILSLWVAAYGSVANLNPVMVAKAPWRNPACLAGAAGILMATLSQPLAMRTLGSPPMVYSGNISYSIYLWHMAVLNLVPAMIGGVCPPAATALFVVMFTLGVASASYRWIEAPARRFLVARLSPRR
jgi:peptidoglycan/LPS O-acetylase OafA/YrhL